MATYVDGEAPETDSEDEQYLFNLSYMKVCVMAQLVVLSLMLSEHRADWE